MVGVMACQQKSPCSFNSILDYKGFLFSADIKHFERDGSALWSIGRDGRRLLLEMPECMKEYDP
jgi:hypothetical protein